MAQKPQEFEPPEIRCHPHPQPPRRVDRHLAHQQAGGKHPAIARCHDPVARAHLVAVLDEIQQRRRAVVARHQRLLPRWLDRPGNGAGRIGEKDHPRRVLPHPRDAAHKPYAVHRRPAVDDSVARAHVQKHRLPEGRSAVGHDHPGDESQPGVKPHIVEIEKPRVFLFKLQRRFLPGLHLPQLGPQFAVLFDQSLVGLEIAHKVDHAGHRRHGPVHARHDAVHHLRAELFHPRAVDAPQKHQTDQAQHHDPQQKLPQGGGVFIPIGTVLRQGLSSSGSVVPNVHQKARRVSYRSR